MKRDQPTAGGVRMEISLRDCPAVIADLRREMARILREAAADEAPVVARRLREVAAAFECGQSAEGLDG